MSDNDSCPNCGSDSVLMQLWGPDIFSDEWVHGEDQDTVKYRCHICDEVWFEDSDK